MKANEIKQLRKQYQDSRVNTSVMRQIAIDRAINRQIAVLGIDENHIWMIAEPDDTVVENAINILTK